MVDITLKTEEEILAFDISDEALEIAAGTVSGNANFTWGVCTAIGSQYGCPGSITEHALPKRPYPKRTFASLV